MNELTKTLHSAAKGRAPIVAVPVDGHAPFCLKRKLLATWVKGVEIVSAEVVQDASTSHYELVRLGRAWDREEQRSCEYEGPHNQIEVITPGKRYLLIKGRAGAVRTSARFLPIDRRVAMTEIRKWAQKERDKNLRVIAQGAIGAVAIKEAQKVERVKAKAAKLSAIEAGSNEAMDEAKAHLARIESYAREHGRGFSSRVEYIDSVDRLKERTVQCVAHHNTPRRIRRIATAIQWRMRSLHSEWNTLTKYNPGRRKTTAKPFLKAKKASEVIRVVQEYAALAIKLRAISPARIPNPRFPEHEWASINPLSRLKPEKQYHYHPHYDRSALAAQLREVRATIAALTPPADEYAVAA